MSRDLAAWLLIAALGVDGARARAPILNPAAPPFDRGTFVRARDNPYFPLRPGTTYVYATRAGDGSMLDSVTVTREMRTILGIPAVQVHEREFHRGSRYEDTLDWYASDSSGNVWYLGESSSEYRNGKVASTEGSWEAGRDGAEPGIVMQAMPKVGERYRQEYRAGAAEDMARVLSLAEAVTVPYGRFSRCIETEEWSPLEPGVREHKYYAPGIGLVLTRAVPPGRGQTELVKVVRP